eukprot:619046-Rhodomonas_salina.2
MPGTDIAYAAVRSDVQELAEKVLCSYALARRCPVGGIRSDTNAIKEALVEVLPYASVTECPVLTHTTGARRCAYETAIGGPEYKKAGEGVKSEVDLVRKDIQVSQLRVTV